MKDAPSFVPESMSPEAEIVQRHSRFFDEPIDPEVRGRIFQVFSREGLLFDRTFNTGHSGNVVIKATNLAGEDYVLKMPQDQRSQEEVVGNIKGYERLAQNGLEDLLPRERRVGSVDEFQYLITTFLGEDFAAACEASAAPEELFVRLEAALARIYERTVLEDDSSEIFISRIKNRIKKNFNEHIIPAGAIDMEPELLDVPVNDLVTPLSCFGVFDFTPEDIYLRDRTIKYPDPKHDVRGNPIIDLACFAGVSRDIMHLPGSVEGYEILHDFATNRVAGLLGLSVSQGDRIFSLGRALQYSLSSRFRTETDLEKAHEFAELSLHYLNKSRETPL